VKLPGFFSYKLNRRILLSFLLIIIIPGFVSFWVSLLVVQKTLYKEIESRLTEAGSVYFEELDAIEQKCIDIVSVYSGKANIVKQIQNRQYTNLEKEMIDFYNMNLVDIIEIEDHEGKVIFRGHNPDLAGDIKIDQKIVLGGLEGKISLSYEHGKSGLAIRAAAPVYNGKEVIGIFMAGSLFSQDFVNRLKSLTLLDNGIYRQNEKIISTYEGTDILDDDIIERLKDGQSIIKLDTTLGSDLYHIIIKPIFLGDNYWGAVLLSLNKQKIENSYRYANSQLTLVILFGLFLAILIYYFLARNINKSISRIITGISNFSFDHPNKAIETDRGDEFGLIADNYNILIERLELYNQRIHRLQNDLVESTRLATVGQVSASLAHEIRNPLSSIKMMAQIIKSRYLDNNNGIDEMNVILTEINRINSKVSELLEFAKPGEMDFTSCDLYAIIDGVLNLCTYTIKEKKITVIKEYKNPISEIFADSEKLRICFLNIVLNALQVMKAGSLLKISTYQYENQIEIKICNTGSSIETENTNKVFEPFFTRRDGGVGLGLSISKIIIEKHRGTISIIKDNDMVCFSIRIPIEIQEVSK
jgi:signal transduction histidine kinase